MATNRDKILVVESETRIARSMARILRRYGARISDVDHADLLAVILEQGQHLARIVPDPYQPLAK